MSERPIDILSKYMGPLADMRKSRLDGKCPFCREVIDLSSFRDDLSYREFEISGLCQKCQDDTFGTDHDS